MRLLIVLVTIDRPSLTENDGANASRSYAKGQISDGEAVISASPKLQHILLFKAFPGPPGPLLEIDWTDSDSDYQAVPGPPGLLLEIDWTDSDSDYLRKISPIACRHTMFINPLLKRQHEETWPSLPPSQELVLSNSDIAATCVLTWAQSRAYQG